MNTTPRKNVTKTQRRTSETGMFPETQAIPDKLYFKIGEVSQITGVEPHVLRYWESEFKIIRPQRATSKQRLYRRVDVEHILAIKKLLYIDGFTVPGARKHLAAGRKAAKKKPKATPVQKNITVPSPDTSMLGELKAELNEIKKMLEE